MSEESPYSDQWDDLPLPDDEQSWQAMKALLDKEEGRRPLLPPFLTGCAGWGVLAGAALLVVALFWMPSGWLNHNKKNPVFSDENNPVTKSTTSTTTPTKKDNKYTGPVISTRLTQATPTRSETQPASLASTAKSKSASIANGSAAFVKQPTAIHYPRNTKAVLAKQENTKKAMAQRVMAKASEAIAKNDNQGLLGQLVAVKPQNPQQDRSDSTIFGSPKTTIPGSASDTTESHTATTQKGDSVIIKPGITKRFFSLSAGVGFQQQIRSGGQVAYSKGYNGKTGLGDHIPSLYLRLHWGKRWLLQGEARFGAPQAVSDFAYSRQSSYDTAAGKLSVTSQRLKKLYYHQFPVSLNYNVTDSWSIGAGVVYSRFYRAVSEQQVQNQNLQSGVQSTAVTIQRISGFRDSFLYKTQVQWLLQTEYSFGRLSLGLRYKRDAQPYIRYTQPTGTIIDGKGEALEAVLRWRLWKSKK